MTARDDLAVSALARALVRSGMYVDAGIDTSAGLDKPQVYAAAILNDPDMAADGLHFVMVETLERAALAASPAPEPTGLDAAWAEAEAALQEGWAINMLWGTTTEDRWAVSAGPFPADEAHALLHVIMGGDTPEAALRALAARLKGDSE